MAMAVGWSWFSLKIRTHICACARSPLSPLRPDTQPCPGFGPRLGKLIETLAGRTVGEPVLASAGRGHRPAFLAKVAEAPEGRSTLTVTVDPHLPPANRRLPYKVRCHDDTAG